ncbi:hypothetical protein [Vreelandella lionensis]|uniref:hypothetical protein n=1 Tax=Vreelandella lionensis TaxID=1144478 RepID=UPI0009F5BE26|nr:hypothetical protein [Halomonas lionensis]
MLVGAGGLLFMFREELGLVDVASQNATDALDANSDAIRQGSAAALDATYDNLVVSLEAVSLQAQEAMAQLTELEARQAFYENSHQGMADSVAGAVDQQTEALAGLWARQVELQTAIRNNRDAREQATSADRAGAQALEDMVVTADALSTSTETVAAASREAAAAADELTKSTEAQASAVEDLRNRLIPGRREVVQLARDMQTLTLAIAMGTGNVAENIQMIGLLQQQYIEAQNDTDDLAAKTVDAAFTMEGAFDELRLNGLRRLDDGFADLWQGAIDGSLNAGDLMKRALDQTLAEMAHMAITRPIVVQLQSMMGMGGGTTTGGQQSGMSLQNINPQALQSGWDTVSGWFGGGGSSASSGLYAGANTGAVSGTLYGSASTGAAQGGLYGNAATGGIAQGGGFMSSAGSLMQTAGAAYAAYQIGNMAGDAISGMVTDKQANSSWGQNIGAAGGFAIGGPVGAGIGAAIGNVVDSLFGSYTPFQGEFVTRDSQFDASSMNRGQRVDAMRAQEEQDFYYGGFYAQSELGDLGFSHSGSQRLHRADGGPMDDSNLHKRAEWGWELAESAAQLDNLVVTLAQGSSDVESMRDAVQSMTLRSGDAADIIQFALVDRSLAALDAAGVRVTESLRSADAEQFATTLEALVGGINMMDAASAQLSLQFDATSNDALYAVDAMAGLAGGMANLSAQNAAYYDAFYTEEEKLADLEQQLAQRFSAMGYSLPQTDGEVRALVESFDLMTQSGREQRQAVMSVIGPLDQYITAMEAQNQRRQ